MTHEEIQALIDQIPCDLCYLSRGMVQYAALAAMFDIANGIAVPATTQELITEAKCLLSCVPPGLVPYLQVLLLRQISQSGGAGPAIPCCNAGVGSPEGVVTANPGAIYTDTSNAWFYVKLTGAGSTGWNAIVT